MTNPMSSADADENFRIGARRNGNGLSRCDVFAGGATDLLGRLAQLLFQKCVRSL